MKKISLFFSTATALFNTISVFAEESQKYNPVASSGTVTFEDSGTSTSAAPRAPTTSYD